MCTCIMIKNNNNTFFGRNMDIVDSFNEKIILIPRNYQINLKKERKISNHFAIIGMGTIINNYPLLADAANEKGLAIAGLSFIGNAKYYEYNDEKINLAPYELVLYLLANYENISQVKTALSQINIINEDFSESIKLTSLHFMISDQNESIVLETTKEGMKIYDNPYNILTNNPPFSYHIENIKNYLHLNNNIPENTFDKKLTINPYSYGQGLIGLPGDYSSSSRFIKALYIKNNMLLTNNCENTIEHFFYCLESVKMIKGIVKTEKGYEYTRYTSCINTTSSIYYYMTYDNHTIKQINLKSHNLNENNLIIYEI